MLINAVYFFVVARVRPDLILPYLFLIRVRFDIDCFLTFNELSMEGYNLAKLTSQNQALLGEKLYCE